jgi:hypothetical protein
LEVGRVNPIALGEKTEGVRLTPDQVRRRKARSVAIAVALAVVVALFYAVTIAKLGANVLNRPL